MLAVYILVVITEYGFLGDKSPIPLLIYSILFLVAGIILGLSHKKRFEAILPWDWSLWELKFRNPEYDRRFVEVNSGRRPRAL